MEDSAKIKMRITKEAYFKLLHCQKVPPEIGGVLVGCKMIVDTVVLDIGIAQPIIIGIRYKPNTKYLNEQLSLLNNRGKVFMGMFHTHACQWDSLSDADIQYIKVIMSKMPIGFEQLFFPVVFPGIGVKSYIAERENLQIKIREDKIELV